MNETISTTERAEVRRLAHERAQRDRCIESATATPVIVQDVMTQIELKLTEPHKLEGEREGYQLQALRLTWTRFPHETDPAEQSMVNVRGWVVKLRADGQPDGRDRGAWVYLPDEIARHYAHLVLTH